ASGIIFDIRRFSVNDGPGIRTTVFFKGCPLKCRWCHNPESWLSEPETFVIARKFDGKIHKVRETIGRLVTVEEVMHEIEKESIFYETSDGGVTFSGGEPLLQPDFLNALTTVCREQGIHTCLDTSGYAEPEIFAAALAGCDLVLYDLKIMDRDKHIRFTGYPNDVIMENLQELDRSGIEYYIRIPYVPGVNSDEENIRAVGDMLGKLKGNLLGVDILPYHPMAAGKLKKMGRKPEMKKITVNDNELQQTAAHFRQSGYPVTIGG
ncbi:MAG: glycyl-radical enzyme activating protein, partial [Bacteroidales bacterium]|nr:glycyl-radical enzyme activating protein [Bacteroidales bacterium]